MVFDAASAAGEVHCRLVYAPVPEGPWKPVGGDNIIEAPDFLPLGNASAFDSHIIFAAASPFRNAAPLHDGKSDDQTEWIYYMGGDGPHSGARKSSFALATLRPDGYAAVRGHGTFRTPSLVVADAMLTATVDFMGDGDGSALRIG
eukprot:2927293-Prymnesium_polylepis.1